MLKHMKKHERVDWFRITVEINNCGISIDGLAKMTDIPRSTIQGWRYKNARPKLEEAIRLLHCWSDITNKDFDAIPIYDPFLPDGFPRETP